MTTVIEHGKRGHSRLGASGAERWMNCPGSVGLLAELKLPESDEPTYRKEGTAMHEAADACLNDGMDTWEIVGKTYNEVMIDAPMADAIQVYLDACRADMANAERVWIEYPISSPVHPDFYGTLDFGALVRDMFLFLAVTDLKGGEGIIVEVEENPQMRYYAFGLIDGLERNEGLVLPDDMPVRLRIAQPRGVNQETPIRDWWTTVGEIKEWVHDTLVPAMVNAEYDGTLTPGSWCRFCPAKLVCPMLTGLFKAMATTDPREIVNADDAALGRNYLLLEAASFYRKALMDEAHRRLISAHTIPGIKLVMKKSNRVFTPEGAKLARKKWGSKAMSKAELKSPAEIEKLGPGAKEWVKEYSYQPSTGYTVALENDKKPAVIIRSTTETFGAAIAALETEDD